MIGINRMNILYRILNCNTTTITYRILNGESVVCLCIAAGILRKATQDNVEVGVSECRVNILVLNDGVACKVVHDCQQSTCTCIVNNSYTNIMCTIINNL